MSNLTPAQEAPRQSFAGWLVEFFEALRLREKAEAEVVDGQSRLVRHLATGREFVRPDTFGAVCQLAYWNEKAFPNATEAARALGFRRPEELQALAGQDLAGLCFWCDSPLFYRSRTARARRDVTDAWWFGERLKCRACKEAEEAEERRETVKSLRSMPYADYLQTDHWFSVRRAALDRADHACLLCSAPGRLQVHHRTYDRRGCEAPSDLVVLCADCHQVFHDYRTLEG